MYSIVPGDPETLQITVFQIGLWFWEATRMSQCGYTYLKADISPEFKTAETKGWSTFNQCHSRDEVDLELIG
jgi:hypothetical protein